MAHIGHPLIGDGKYGVNREEKQRGFKFQALYSYKLKFLEDPEENLLSYLTGKCFSIDRDSIWFVHDIDSKEK
jgi:23S rRNA pseudouridine955/2504/2580 synthase